MDAPDPTDGPTPLDAQLLEGPVEPTPMPRPLTDEEMTIRSLRRAVLRAQQQGRALMVIGFVSGLVCGGLLVVLYGGIGG